MAEPSPSSGAPLSPDDVAGRPFPTSFRGYDPAEVRAFLIKTSAALREANDRVARLEAELQRERAREVKPVVDEATLTAALGEETARLLRSAQEAAHDIRAKAEDNAQRMLREAHDEATRMRSAAETVLADRSAEAEDAAGLILAEAEARARAFSDRASAEAEVELERARNEGRRMVEESHAHREKVLADLGRRKRTLQHQLDVLRGGRDHLVERVREVRVTLDELAERLTRPEPEAPEPAPAPASGESEAVPDVIGERRTSSFGPPEADTASATETAAPAAIVSPSFGEAPREPASAIASKPARPVVTNGGAPLDDDSRVSSSLRILRKGSPEPPPPEPPARPGLSPVERQNELERVRIIGPAARPVAPEPEPAPVPDPVPEPEAEARTEASPEHDHEAALAESLEGGSEAERDSADTATTADIVTTVQAEAPAVREPSAEGVEALFARIRADREASVADAKTTPAQPAASAATAATDDAVTADAADEAAPTAPAADAAAHETAAVSNADETALQARDAEVEPIEAQLLRKVKRALQDEQNDVLDRLRTVRGRPTAVAVLPGPDEHVARYRKAAFPFLRDLALAGSGGANVEVADLAGQLAAELAEPLLDRLRRALPDTDDLDAASASDRLSSAYREWKGERIERVVSYYVIAAHARGALSAQPDGTTLRWIVDDDGGPCPDCDDNALAGLTPKGEAFPTGQHHPPAHVGCRCVLAPTSA